MSETYYYMKEGMFNDETIGPVSLQEIAMLLLQGKVTPRTLASKTGDAEWQRIKDYPVILSTEKQMRQEKFRQAQEQAAELERQKQELAAIAKQQQQQQEQAAEVERQKQAAAAEEAQRQAAQHEQQQQEQAAELERQKQAAAAEEAQRQAAQHQQQQVLVAARREQLTTGLKQEGDYRKKFKLVCVATTHGKEPLYERVHDALSRHGESGWALEHMHETHWKASRGCGQDDVTENVMVIVFSVPAAIADEFPDIV